MEYTISKLANISGISTRTLRYYDQIGLLQPARVDRNGYRIYGNREVDLLQQILFYRELGVTLNSVRKMITSDDFDLERTLQGHLENLKQERRRIDLLIENVAKSISSMKGETQMTDNEKFEGFKQELINENEKKYGKEIREKYGDKNVDDSNSRVSRMTQEQFDEAENIRQEFEKVLESAFNSGDPCGELAMKACELHKRWLCVFYDKYSKEYHRNLGKMYVADERFRANYDKIAPKCTEFLRDAINAFCE